MMLYYTYEENAVSKPWAREENKLKKSYDFYPFLHKTAYAYAS